MTSKPYPAIKATGRPARYLLGGIAECGVCGATMRSGTQNAGRQHSDGSAQPERYKVYECIGMPGQSGFHVSMRQEHLDEIVTEAVLARVVARGFRPPRTFTRDEHAEERRALRLQLKADYNWLDKVRAAAESRGEPRIIEGQERLVLPRIKATLDRLEILEEADPVVQFLRQATSARRTWLSLNMTERRHIVRTLLVPRVNPVGADALGRRGLNADRVELVWREDVD